MKLCNEIVPVASLGATDRSRLFALYSEHYAGTTFDQFASDLAEKDVVILLRDRSSGGVRGFSTQMLLRIQGQGQPVRAVFSGDTIIAPSHWGDQELRRGWCRYAGAALEAEPGVPLYWLLISKGYRTYLYLPLFFLEYFPRYDRATPHNMQSLLDAFAHHKFGEAYDAASGLIRFPQSHGQLAPPLAGVPVHRADDPHVQFFLRRNPDHVHGVELACLTEISHENIRPFARRMFWNEQRAAAQQAGGL